MRCGQACDTGAEDNDVEFGWHIILFWSIVWVVGHTTIALPSQAETVITLYKRIELMPRSSSIPWIVSRSLFGH